MIVCMIGFVLLLTSLLFSIIKTDSSIFIEFEQMLNENQKMIYKEIIKQRSYIYISGSLVGFIVSILFYYHSKYKYKICGSFALFYGIQLIYYKIYPKYPLMLYYLTDKKQVDKWADIYLFMKRRWNISLMLSFIGYIIFIFFVY